MRKKCARAVATMYHVFYPTVRPLTMVHWCCASDLCDSNCELHVTEPLWSTGGQWLSLSMHAVRSIAWRLLVGGLEHRIAIAVCALEACRAVSTRQSKPNIYD